MYVKHSIVPITWSLAGQNCISNSGIDLHWFFYILPCSPFVSKDTFISHWDGGKGCWVAQGGSSRMSHYLDLEIVQLGWAAKERPSQCLSKMSQPWGKNGGWKLTSKVQNSHKTRPFIQKTWIEKLPCVRPYAKHIAQSEQSTVPKGAQGAEGESRNYNRVQ